MSRQDLENHFPRLRKSFFEITSERSHDYNCIAWAAGDAERWWWPTVDGYWPAGSARGVSIETFVSSFKALGFAPCEDGKFEAGFEKIALYADGDKQPTHMARQLPNGKWTSKCGKLEDISHDLEGLEGTEYGRVECFLKRPISNGGR